MAEIGKRVSKSTALTKEVQMAICDKINGSLRPSQTFHSPRDISSRLFRDNTGHTSVMTDDDPESLSRWILDMRVLTFFRKQIRYLKTLKDPALSCMQMKRCHWNEVKLPRDSNSSDSFK
ncbi:hypothetical protein CEXT_766211 [Caerostris extrusa]|uniref:Uncharacterized protein n=1 Tax=Caerostris extrusa TaxID=172846 RepID=A0AAV4NYS0_CAEEX|nr:hypothetical protein CEXT_766211 [Caerostris extrusa]